MVREMAWRRTMQRALWSSARVYVPPTPGSIIAPEIWVAKGVAAIEEDDDIRAHIAATLHPAKAAIATLRRRPDRLGILESINPFRPRCPASSEQTMLRRYEAETKEHVAGRGRRGRPLRRLAGVQEARLPGGG